MLICAKCKQQYRVWDTQQVDLIIDGRVIARFTVCKKCAQQLADKFNTIVLGEEA